MYFRGQKLKIQEGGGFLWFGALEQQHGVWFTIHYQGGEHKKICCRKLDRVYIYPTAGVPLLKPSFCAIYESPSGGATLARNGT